MDVQYVSFLYSYDNYPVKMKILVFTDTHGSEVALQKVIRKAKKYKPEIMLCAGDFTIFMHKIEEEMKKINCLKIKTFIIHGNHEDEQKVEELCKNLKNIEFIHKRIVRYGNLLIMGYGGGGFGSEDKEFLVSARTFETFFKKHKNCKKLLLLHQPPHRSGIDLVYGEHAGNKTTKTFIDKHKIEFVVAGHLHENSGKEFTMKRTRYINPGPWGKIITI